MYMAHHIVCLFYNAFTWNATLFSVYSNPLQANNWMAAKELLRTTTILHYGKVYERFSE